MFLLRLFGRLASTRLGELLLTGGGILTGTVIMLALQPVPDRNNGRSDRETVATVVDHGQWDQVLSVEESPFYLVRNRENGVQSIDRRTGEMTKLFTNASRRITCLSWLPGSSVVAATSEADEVLLQKLDRDGLPGGNSRRLEGFEECDTITQPFDVGIPDHCVMGIRYGSGDNHLVLVNTNSARQVSAIVTEGLCVKAVVEPHGQNIAIGTTAGTVELVRLKDNLQLERVNSFSGDAAVMSLCFSPDGDWIYRGGISMELEALSLDPTRENWTMRDLHQAHLVRVQTSPSGEIVATLDARGILWFVRADDQTDFWRLPDSDSKVVDFQFLPNSEELRTVDQDGGTELWNFETGERLYRVDRQPVEL